MKCSGLSAMSFRTLLLAGLLVWSTVSLPALAQEGHGNPLAPFRTVEALDLHSYAGEWYEIARFPNRYQRNCNAIVAEYRPRSDGNYDVRGICPDRRPGRNASAMEGVARRDGPAELSVGLTAWLPLFRRSVFVLDMAPDYSVAVVGEPRRKYAWIMARAPVVTDAQYNRAITVLRENGYVPELLERLSPVSLTD
jgi:apolipoprotein D and lipocalin family protein